MPGRDISKYDCLDARKQLEQALVEDLRAAFESRGCTVVHHGTATMCAPGGVPDIEIRDPAHERLILMEVTRRKGAAADGEFIAVKDHLEKAIATGSYKEYCCFFVSPRTSARMSATIRDLYNRTRERDGKKGRVVALDFVTMELLLRRLGESDPALFPSERLGLLFQKWQSASDDMRTRRLIAEVVLAEDTALADKLGEEMRAIDAEREQRLKKEMERLEDRLRDRGITGNAANTALVYLTFMRLYEEKCQREGTEKTASLLSPSTRGRTRN